MIFITHYEFIYTYKTYKFYIYNFKKRKSIQVYLAFQPPALLAIFSYNQNPHK